MARGREVPPTTKREIYTVYQEEGLHAALEHGKRRGVSARSVYLLIKSENGVFARAVHPGAARRWSPEQVARLVARVEEEPVSTLEELAVWGDGQGFPRVSPQTIASYLEGELITYKVARIEPMMRNAVATKEARYEYAGWYLRTDINRIVFVDETGICLWTTRNRGRALIGMTPRIIVSSQRETNRTIAMAIAFGRGVLCSQIRTHAFNAGDMRNFLGEVCGACHMNGLDNPIIVLDNSRIHSPEDLEDLREAFGVEHRFLPPWSPMLNPIEEVFADFKRSIRTQISMNLRADLAEIERGPRGDKGRRRGAILMQAYAASVGALGRETVDAHILHTNSIVGHAMRMEDM